MDHLWRHVPPVVAPLGEPGETYNAVCDRCGAKAWLHWRPVDRADKPEDAQTRKGMGSSSVGH